MGHCCSTWSRRLLAYHVNSSFITSFIFLPLSFRECYILRILNYLQFPKPSILFLVPYLTTIQNDFGTKSSNSNILQKHLCRSFLPVPKLRDITHHFLYSVFHTHISISLYTILRHSSWNLYFICCYIPSMSSVWNIVNYQTYNNKYITTNRHI